MIEPTTVTAQHHETPNLVELLNHEADFCRLVNSVLDEDTNICETGIVSDEENSLFGGPLPFELDISHQPLSLDGPDLPASMPITHESRNTHFSQDMSQPLGNTKVPLDVALPDPVLSHGLPPFFPKDIPNEGSTPEQEISMMCPTNKPVVFSTSEVKLNAFFFVMSRGGTSNDRPGNRRLRRIIGQFAKSYVQAHRSERGALKNQVFDLCRTQFEFVIQKKSFLRFYFKDQEQAGRRQLSNVRVQSIIETNGGMAALDVCAETEYIRVGNKCALDVVGHLLRDAANELRRSQKIKAL